MMQAFSPAAAFPTASVLRYRLEGFSDDWIIPEEPVPEAPWHDACLELFKALLTAWVAASGRDAAVYRDIAIRTNPARPSVGFNPDVCLVEPPPAEPQSIDSLRLWEHPGARLAFEAVSRNHPYKDYALVPEKCAVTGVTELVVFDPLLAGPKAQGGPWLLQLWRRAEDGGFERVYAGDGATRSLVLDAYLVPNARDRRLRIAEQADGSAPWLTAEQRAQQREQQAQQREQQAQQSAEDARKSAEQARQREQEALRRIAELEAALRRR